MVAHAQRGLAAVRAVRANRGNVLHLPGTCFVTISATGERADRADVDAHAALFALEMIFAVGNDDTVRAAHAHAERLNVHALIAHAHAAEAENAARRVIVNELRPLLFGPVNFFFDETAGVGTI